MKRKLIIHISTPDGEELSATEIFVFQDTRTLHIEDNKGHEIEEIDVKLRGTTEL